MRERSRRWLMRLCWAGLLVTGAMLVGLRVGRPVYYTDGQREISGGELSAAGMLMWQTPEVEVELPGPVEGRVAELPDGRLLYGRTTADGTTDLVVFDPTRPNVAPEPAYGLNTDDNELAPACAADGSVFFASDRPGVGGYDLYRATWTVRGFTRPEPLELCNTAYDETDPAPAPDGQDFVFVRIDREQKKGDNGVLYRAALGSGIDPDVLFTRGRTRTAVDRDPAFAADGGALWFVRRDVGIPLHLSRVSMLHGELDQPVAVGDEWKLNGLRGPNPAADGNTLGLLQARSSDDGSDLWFVSAAREVYPWWLGQRTLEWILLGLFTTCLLLLLLLHLGRRWTALDLLAQCLLLSLLLHILIFLWLMGVEITGALLDGNEEGGSLEITVVTSAPSDASTASDGQRLASVAAMVKFDASKREFEVATPGAATERVRASAMDAPDAGYESDATAAETSMAASVDDQEQLTPQRDGSDAAIATEQATLPAVAATERASRAAASSALVASATEPVVVHTPGGTVGRASSTSEHASAGSAGQRAEPTARSVEVSEPALASSMPVAVAARRDASAASETAPAPSATATDVAGPVATTQNAATSAKRGAAGAKQLEIAEVAPAGLLARGGSSGQLEPRGSARQTPAAASQKASSPASVALQDRRATAELSPPAAGEDAPAATIERASRPLAGPVSQQVPRTSRAPGTAARAALEVAPMSPSSQLSRAARQAPGPQPGRSSLMTRSAPRKVAARDAALRDASPPAPSLNGHSKPKADPAMASPGRLAFALSKSDNPLHRPRRSQKLGVIGAVMPAVAVPGSLVEAAETAALEIGTAPTLAAGPRTAYSNRFGPAKAKALERFGGTKETERAVRDGLRYLARIQNEDGSWGDVDLFDREKYGSVYVGKSALCVLAFLGAGHTPSSDTEHSAVVERAIAHLLNLQEQDSGAFGPSSCYGHGITTYALAECYGMTKDEALLPALEKGLNWILANQGPRRDRRNRGGWGYFSPGLRREDSYARVSVTAWMVMALESARMSGIGLPEDTMPLAREYLVNSFDRRNGWFRYNHKPSRLASGWPTLPASTPAGAFCLQLLGATAEDRMVQAALQYTVTRRPREYRRYSDNDFVLRGQGNVYFWYYGTLCCFLAGGDAWEAWNKRLSTLLPASQSEDGSFAPIDVYAIDAGDTQRDRSYTTAMCVLSLEVYYRYFTPLLIGR